MCLGLFVIELYQKIHQNIRTISACQLYFSKARAVHKLAKELTAQQNSFFFFSSSELDSFLIPSARGSEAVLIRGTSAVAACTNKTSCKTGVPPAPRSEDAAMETGGGNVWLLLLASPATASLSHPSRNAGGTTLGPRSPPGKSQIISHSARSKGKGCVYHKIAILYIIYNIATAIPLLLGTSKPPAQLPSLQKGEGPNFYLFIASHVEFKLEFELRCLERKSQQGKIWTVSGTGQEHGYEYMPKSL